MILKNKWFIGLLVACGVLVVLYIFSVRAANERIAQAEEMVGKLKADQEAFLKKQKAFEGGYQKNMQSLANEVAGLRAQKAILEVKLRTIEGRLNELKKERETIATHTYAPDELDDKFHAILGRAPR